MGHNWPTFLLGLLPYFRANRQRFYFLTQIEPVSIHVSFLSRMTPIFTDEDEKSGLIREIRGGLCLRLVTNTQAGDYQNFHYGG